MYNSKCFIAFRLRAFVQGGIHLLSGLILASFLKRKEFKVGVAFGAIFPDIDLFIAAIAYLFIGESAEKLHRTFTHSLFFILLVCGSIAIYPYARKFLTKKAADSSNYDFTGFALGLALGMITHVILDLFYLVGVSIFWPFYQRPIGFPLVPDNKLTILQLKLLQTTDFYTDIFLFYIPMLILSYRLNVHKKLRLPFLLYIVVDFSVITFFVIYSFNNNVSYNDHLVYLYYPGTFFLLISVFSPLLFRDVIRQFKFKPTEIVIVTSLFLFSQFLFGLFLI